MKKEKSLTLRFLYNTVPGRVLLKILVNPSVSEKAAVYLSSEKSEWLIDRYIKKYDIDISGCKKQKFSSFNDFFKREKYLDISTDRNKVISPCDGFLSVYSVSDDLVLNIKNTGYTLRSLLKSNKMAEDFSGGMCMIFRLEPHHYHRYVYAVSGKIKFVRKIKGVLHCVRPVACSRYPVYTQNTREYTLIKSPEFGNVIQMEIGAMLVGKIQNHMNTGEALQGQEKGYFEYGGSTVVLIFQKDAVNLNGNLKYIVNSGIEVPVHAGSITGRK